MWRVSPICSLEDVNRAIDRSLHRHGLFIPVQRNPQLASHRLDPASNPPLRIPNCTPPAVSYPRQPRHPPRRIGSNGCHPGSPIHAGREIASCVVCTMTADTGVVDALIVARRRCAWGVWAGVDGRIHGWRVRGFSWDRGRCSW